MNFPIEIYFIFFVVALIYSSVGHGGASAYIAIFALFGFASTKIVSIPLALNIVVASISFINYYRTGYFKINLLLPFVISSIPFAFIGGMIEIPEMVFNFLISIALFFSGARLLFVKDVKIFKEPKKISFILSAVIGAALGLISGMIGIGGGVFLSPLILFFGWANTKETAAVSSAFIVLNSIAGILSHSTRGNFDFNLIFPFLFVVLIGGYFGSILGSAKLSVRRLQTILGIILLSVGIKTFLPFFVS